MEELYEYCKNGDLDGVKFLIGSGIDVNETYNKQRPLEIASSKGHLEIVKALVTAGAQPDLPDVTSSTTPLMDAVWMCRIKVIEYLISIGADLNLADDQGWTALMLASMQGHGIPRRLNVVKTLVEAGAELDKVGNDGCTALMHAAYSGYLETVQILAQAGANTRIMSKKGKLAVDIARKQVVVAFLNEWHGRKVKSAKKR